MSIREQLVNPDAERRATASLLNFFEEVLR
jgi:hypothetical protein